MARRSVRLGAAIVIAAGGFVAFGVTVGSAEALSPVACGLTVTTNVTLHRNLVGCPADGLIVGASGITIDLNGHTISGTNAPGGEGIADDGFGNVVVENGQIHTFFVNGVGLRNAPASIVRNLAIRDVGAGGVDNQFSAGISVENSPAIRLTRNAISNNVVAFEADGIVVKSSPGARIDHNRLNRNSWDGLFVFSSPNSRVEENVADANPNNGMEINGASDNTRVTGNEASKNGNVGIAAGAMQGAVIDGNTANANGLAASADDAGLFFFDLNDSLIAHNHASRNHVGIDLFGGLHGSTGNQVVANTVNGNVVVGLLIDSGDGGTLANGANDNAVIRNVADRNHGGGIGVSGTGNRLERNQANANTGDGVLVAAAGNTITMSTADRNTAHGIVAIMGTIDGGGNRARGNEPPQCVGVVCR